METPNTLQEAILYFADAENCRKFMIEIRWADGKVKCPYCGSEKVSYLENAKLYKCYGDHAKAKFSLKIGTIFEDSPLSLDKWLVGFWLLYNCKNGISSHEIASHLGITQKSAWHMMHRIRFSIHTGTFEKATGHVEADETFIGGKARNMHAGTRAKRITGTGGKDKVPVLGIMERGGKVRTIVVNNRRKKTLQGEVRKHVEAGSTLYTDFLLSYEGLDEDYAHRVVDHAVEYVRDNVVHTNSLENYWSLLKRCIGGTYVSVEPFHLFRYLDEQAFRFNNRKDEDGNPLKPFDRFKLAVSQVVGKRLTWNQVTGKDEENRLSTN